MFTRHFRENRPIFEGDMLMDDKIDVIKTGGSIRIKLSGRITAENSGVLSAVFDEQNNISADSEAVIDADELSYISSAGLRVLISAQKKYGCVRMENVNDAVYDIMSVTGMTEIMTVTKRLKELSVDGLPLLGKGGTAAVYRLDEDRIVKVFSEHIDFKTVLNEQRACRSALKAGIATAIPYELAKVGKCYASVTELVTSSTLTEKLMTEPENRTDNIGRYVDLVTGLNEIKVSEPDFKSMKSHYLGMTEYVREYLTEQEYICFTGMINNIPDGSGFVHGDCHTGNIMSQGDELLLIDMATAGYGHWFFELFCVYFTYGLVAKMSDPEQSLGLSREICAEVWEKALDGYRKKYPDEDWSNMERKCEAYAKLKMLLSTLPEREMAKAVEPVLKQLSSDLLSEY